MNLRDELWLGAFYVAWFGMLLLWPLAACIVFQGRPWGRRASVIGHAAWLASLAVVALWLDQWQGVSDSWTYCLVVLFLGLGMSALVTLRLRSRPAQWATLAFVATVATMFLVDLTPVKPYLRFYAAIQEGMTRADVLTALHREFPDGGRYPVPTLGIDEPDHLNFNLDLRDGRWDAECVGVTLREGRVVSKEYLGD